MDLKPLLEGDVNLIFIRAGISKKGNPYLQCSNGRSEIFIDIPKGVHADDFRAWSADFVEDSIITLRVATVVGTNRVRLVDDPTRA